MTVQALLIDEMSLGVEAQLRLLLLLKEVIERGIKKFYDSILGRSLYPTKPTINVKQKNCSLKILMYTCNMRLNIFMVYIWKVNHQ